jgi:L-alanine-DL-glutamate epimerase-like enolase superfamily enzyme
MKVTDLQCWLVEIPQKYPIAPYQNRYRPGTHKQSLIWRAEADNGLVGWGETPQDILKGPLTEKDGNALKNRVLGWDPYDMEDFFSDEKLQIGNIYLSSGIEMALWDLVGKDCGQPLYKLLGGAVQKEIELAACMGIQPYDKAGEIAKLYVEWGYSTLKTKAGRDAAEDLEMVRGVRDAVGEKLELRIDPNQGYDPETATKLAIDLEQYDLQYFEQPMPKDLIAEAADLRMKTSTPIALNESVTTPEIVDTILNLGAADVVLPDTYQCGGITGVKKVTTLAEAAGIPCVFHCSHDLGPKTATMLHIVASSPAYTYGNDCTYYGLEDDIITEPFQIKQGHMHVPERPGLGVEVDMGKIEKYRKAL